MGYISHNAIVVTGYGSYIKDAHIEAIKTCSNLVSPIVEGRVNGDSSFFVAPDCSKEGWLASEKGDSERNLLIEYLQSISSLDWVEIRYGGDEPDLAEITRSPCRK